MIDYQYDDGGRETAGYRGRTGDCVVRAIAVCARQDYRAVYLTMAEQMKRNGYAASGNAYAIRERHRRAPRRKGQINARRVQDRVLALYGFRKVRLPAGARPTFTEAHERFGDCIAGTTKHVAAVVDGGAARHIRRPRLPVGQAPDGVPRGTSSARRRRPASRRASARGPVRLGPGPSGKRRVSKEGATL